MGDGLLVPAAGAGGGGSTGLGFGVTQSRAWDGIWLARVRPPRARLDRRDRDPVPHAELRSARGRLGRQLPAHRAAEERREPVDRLRPQPGTLQSDGAGRLVGIEDASQGVGLDVKPYVIGTHTDAPGSGQPSKFSGHGRRRSLLQPDAAAQVEPDHQHRLRADRGRRSAGQPHALSAVLSGEAGLLSRGIRQLRLLARAELRLHGVLQPADRPRRRGPAAEDRLRRQADRAGRPLRSRRAAGAHGAEGRHAR